MKRALKRAIKEMKKTSFWLHIMFDAGVAVGFLLKYLSLRESGMLFAVSYLFEIMMNDDKIEDARDVDDRFSYLALKMLSFVSIRIAALVYIYHRNG